MEEKELRAVVIATLKTIAPEVEEGDLRPDRPLRNQVDLDSMDWLNFLIGLHEKLKVDIPEADYAKLVTLGDVLDYLQKKLNKKGGFRRPSFFLALDQAIARRRLMRSSVAGWVLNRPRRPPPESGFMIIICAVSGCASAVCMGMPRA